MITVLLIGASGQLGSALHKSVPEGVKLITPSRQELDLTNLVDCRNIVKTVNPHWLINAAAYTAVDKAEDESDLAFMINARAPAEFSLAVKEIGAQMIQISTDYVFDGLQSTPYNTNKSLSPLGAYGKSKAAAEFSIQENLANDNRGFVIRTSWLYGPVGKNFMHTMLYLHSKNSAARTPISVISDQIGCPTSTTTLSNMCWRLIDSYEQHNQIPSLLHCSDAGAASWYDFALAIGELGVQKGLLKDAAEVLPITTSDYPTLAVRPQYSLLSILKSYELLGIKPLHWRSSLCNVLTTLANQRNNS